MKVKSFFIYSTIVQTVLITLIWSVMSGALSYFYVPNADNGYRIQKLILLKSYAEILNDEILMPEQFTITSNKLLGLYVNLMTNGLGREYSPAFIVKNKKGDILYSNRTIENTLSNDADLIEVKYKDPKSSLELIIRDSKTDVRDIIGDPFWDTVIPFMLILGVMISATVISSYICTRSLRRESQYIAHRAVGDFAPINLDNQYFEIKPLVKEINKLLKRVEEATAKERQHITDSTHELRTPISAIVAQLHILMMTDNENEKLEVINEMNETLKRVTLLSHQLIYLSKLEETKDVAKKDNVAVFNIISNSILVLASKASSKNIAITTDIPKDFIIKTDGDILTQIIINIIENSIKYSQKNAMIEIEYQSSKNEVSLIISDNGPGIPADVQSRVFDRYYRVNNTNENGSGLGLYIVTKLAAMIGAEITIVNGLNGAGVGFKISFGIES
ncbi:sensor histidine kinase [Morganella psychrotolerans]|uniref:sensor histidine kinase n=1 Tax=Morganella psychrotolerans TaxID=368603 RepID=UPI0039B0206B